MDFDQQKKTALLKAYGADRSKKGSIDKEILSLVDLINKHQDYYTTSSCAGRIMLFLERTKKNESLWLFSSHEPVGLEDIAKTLESPPEETVWLRMEPPIIHVCARDLDCADAIIKMANESGFRRSSLLNHKKRAIVEIMIPEKMDAPVSEKNRLLVDQAYLEILIKHANSRLLKTREKLKKFESAFTSLISRQ